MPPGLGRNAAVARHHQPETGSRQSIVWLLRDEFTTAAGAPLTSPHTAEPGPGQWTLVDTGNQASISGGVLHIAAGAAIVTLSDISRAHLAGRAALFSAHALSGGRIDAQIGNARWEVGFGALINIRNLSFVAILVPLPFTADISNFHRYALVRRAGGGIAFFADSKLCWISDEVQSTAALVAILTNSAAGFAGDAEWWRVRDLGGIFLTDLGIAENNITTFTQSVGPELLLNPAFTNWTADNPDGWTISGEVGADPEITQRAPGSTHGGAGTGAANLFASGATAAPNADQAVLSVNSWYEMGINVSAFASGLVQFADTGGIGFSVNTTGIRKTIIRATTTTIRIKNSSAAAHDFTVDDATVKLLTLNAQVTMDPNSIIDFSWSTLPGVALASAQLRYRIQDDQNYWVAYVQWNNVASNLDFNLDSVSAGVATNRINVTGINTSTDTIRVICDGNLHDCYTKAGSTWTKRGSQITNSSFAAATGLNTVYSTGTTPGSLISYRRSSAAYSVLDAT